MFKSRKGRRGGRARWTLESDRVVPITANSGAGGRVWLKFRAGGNKAEYFHKGLRGGTSCVRYVFLNLTRSDFFLPILADFFLPIRPIFFCQFWPGYTISPPFFANFSLTPTLYLQCRLNGT